jgi:hypothetical protein
MDNISNSRQLPSWRPGDLAVLNCVVRQLWQWPAANRQPVGVRILSVASGVQLQRRGANAYAMWTMATASLEMQGGRIAASDVHVTDTKFSTRLGPPPLRPPV